MSDAIRTINKTKIRRFFTINGSGRYSMVEVISEFVKKRLDESEDLPDIEDELKSFTNEPNRKHVSDDSAKVYRSEKGYFKFDHKGSTYYLTKEWGKGDQRKNFYVFEDSVNSKYPDFRVEEIG